MNDSYSAFRRGRVRNGLPYRLDRHDSVSIGSDAGCHIVIEGADSHHAKLLWNAEYEAWIIYDDPAPSETRVNGVSIQSARLNEGDWFDVAGVRIRYVDGVLVEIDAEKPVGLSVKVHKVSVAAGGKRRLDNISFSADEGKFVALLGPSGCGKSTLIQRIAGLAPFEGEILLNGHDIRKQRKLLFPLVAYLPQHIEDTLHADMTSMEAMEDFARCHLSANVWPDFIKKLEEVGLDKEDDRTKPIRELSGGQKRRLALALELMREPQLLLLDEPTAGLDPATEAGIMELLRRLSDQGRTVICATHVLSSLDKCDEVVVLAPGGQLAFYGAPSAATAHFGTREDWLSVYRMLENGQWEHYHPENQEIGRIHPHPHKLPDAPKTASFGSVFLSTFKRLMKSVCSRRNALLFFGSPVGVALVLAVAGGSMFGSKGAWETACFCMAVAMFWLGLSGAVRSLVSERVPKRCLDMMRGVPLIRYFTAHVAIVAFSAALQSLLFVIPVFILRGDARYFNPWALPTFWSVLALTSFAGGCVGLAVSAVSKKELQAVWLLPFVAILALFLSKPVLEDKINGGQEDNLAIKVSSWLMPTIHTQEYLDAELEKYRIPNKTPEKFDEKHKLFLAVPGMAYPFLFLPLAFYLQKRRENKWDGRN